MLRLACRIVVFAAVAAALPAAASSAPVSTTFTISGREYAFTSTHGFFAGTGAGNRGGTAYWNASVKHDKLGSSPTYVNGGSVALTVRNGGISVDAIVATFAHHGGTISTLDRGTNCTNQKYLVTGRLARVLTTTSSNGTGSLSVTLTHFRHRVLGRCIAYKASVAGTVTFAY
jgi:hypothetical protein